jgi:hypothetical protein
MAKLNQNQRNKLGLEKGQTFKDAFGFSQKDVGRKGTQAAINNFSTFDKENGTFGGVDQNTALTNKGKSIFGANGQITTVGNRKKPLGQASSDIVGNATQDAVNDFEFDDLPDSGADRFGDMLSTIGAGQSNPFMQNAGQTLFENAQTAQQGAGFAAQDRDAALQEVQSLQRQALSPELDPAQRQFFQDRADARRNEIMTRFDEGGDINQVFAKQRGVDVADLESMGVLDSTTGSNTLGYRDAQLGGLANQLFGDASELSRQELLGERGDIRDTATQFGGLQAGQSQAAGNLFNSLLGTANQAAGTAGQLGNASIANQIQALLGGGQLGLDSRGLEADLQLAQQGQTNANRAQGFDMIQAWLDRRFNRQQGKAASELQRQLAEQQSGGGGIPGIPFI